MITYRQLDTFLAVVRTGSLTKAAREIRATQPTVSLQLKAMRRFLGKPLFDRSGGGFRLTPAGEKLRRYAEEVLGGLRVLQQDVAGLDGNIAGPLAVGATLVVNRYVIPSAVNAFRDHFPDVTIQLDVDGAVERLFSHTLSNTLDVMCLIAVPLPAGLTVEWLCDEELIIIASPRHPLSGRRVTPQRLSAEPCVVPFSTLLRELIVSKLRAAGITPKVVAEGRHHDEIKRLVERNVGYSMLIKASANEELARGRLVALRLAGPPVMTEIIAAIRSDSAVSPLVRKFIGFLRTDLNRARGTPKRASGSFSAEGTRSSRAGHKRSSP
jgi:LysR family transcriptional regulator, low CO2-responsive transcriptional regulator